MATPGPTGLTRWFLSANLVSMNRPYALSRSNGSYGQATSGLDRTNTTRPDRETINAARKRAGLEPL